MSDKRKILVQLDADAQPSLFDRIVALDAGVDELLSYGQVKMQPCTRSFTCSFLTCP